MKLVVNTTEASGEAILYLLELDIDGKRVYKIGITSRKIEDRVVEILTSHFSIYRHFPYCRPKRFRHVSNTYEKEQELHKYLDEYRYEPYNKFDGSTELFYDIKLDILVDLFETIYNGKELEYKKRRKTCKVCGKKMKFKTEKGYTCGMQCS